MLLDQVIGTPDINTLEYSKARKLKILLIHEFLKIKKLILKDLSM